MSKSILQEMYDHEINFTISVFWDMGFDLTIGDKVNGIKDEHYFDTFEELEDYLRNYIDNNSKGEIA